MKKTFLVILITLSYLTIKAQLPTNRIDTVPATLIICDSSISNSGQQVVYWPYNEVVPYKYSVTNRPLVKIDGYVVQELVGYGYLREDSIMTNPTIVYRYMDKDMKSLNSKWVYKWKTRN